VNQLRIFKPTYTAKWLHALRKSEMMTMVLITIDWLRLTTKFEKQILETFAIKLPHFKTLYNTTFQNIIYIYVCVCVYVFICGRGIFPCLCVWKVPSYLKKKGVSKQSYQETIWTTNDKVFYMRTLWGTSLPTTGTSKHNVHNIKAGSDVYMTCKSSL
jgi:hypothetical protein